MAEFDMPIDELRRYRPQVAEPDDFDPSWARTLTQARQHPCLLAVKPVENHLTLVDSWDVTFAGYDGHPIRAWYSRPARHGTVTGNDAGSDDAQPLPAVVEYLGYGRGRGLPHERTTWVNAGYAHLLMDSRGQGGQYGSGGDTDDPVGSGPAGQGFLTRGIASTSTHYYRRLITDAVRAVDAVRQLPGVDPARVAVVGNSQGGGLALAVAGLADNLTAVLASAPFLCHPRRALELTEQDPWGEVMQYLSVFRDAVDATFRTLSYVDGVSFARRATAPAHFGVGLRDSICPPSTVFAAYNQYGDAVTRADVADSGPAHSIEVYPYNHHEGGEAHHVRRQLEWLRAVLPIDAPACTIESDGLR
ncbi:acetylxylan esterase [Pengzhenrongella sicca]|uniref:Acetylxylan esterase n=1 Tax=Pengzhenrongella sicca TaxID=2819238 RepID=A0A8A4ZBU4_9MICO|nr:acetylxylan esterase [Pengzhenrongella sicca]QTE29392.1 acetylxylan esterase [Pengzhenrongella sicca]